MTRNSDLDLDDLRECTHEADMAIDQNGKLEWYCRCGRRINTTSAPLAELTDEEKELMLPEIEAAEAEIAAGLGIPNHRRKDK